MPNDSATLTGDANLNGSLTFTLFNDATCGAGGGTSQYTTTVTVTNAASGSTFSTNNTTTAVVVVANDGNYSWLVHYNDNVLADPPDSCSETTAISITNWSQHVRRIGRVAPAQAGATLFDVAYFRSRQ